MKKLSKLFKRKQSADEANGFLSGPHSDTGDSMKIDDKNINGEKQGDKGFFSDDLKTWRKDNRQKKREEKRENKLAAKTGDELDSRPVKSRVKWSRKSKVLFICMCVFLGVFIVAGSIALAITSNPLGSFDTVGEQFDNLQTSTPEPKDNSMPDRPEDATPTPEPTLSPYEELMSYADLSILEDTINIMLIGTDYAPERETWSGKREYHADVMMVLSINKETKKVSLISLPRDTYANIPGVEGIYKLNASINCGGGWPTEKGFKKVCEAAEWMLGGVKIDYYYAVDMSAVKGLVDAIGGVDYDLDISFDNQGRVYEKGFQHMDGQAVLDYLRVRKPEHIKQSGQSGDLKRIDRQKRMLIAIFDKIKDSDLLANIPKIIEAFDGNLHTNLSTMQTAGLAVFAYNVNPDDIGMYSMGGTYYNIFNWNFVITDQKKRANVTEAVFGFRAKPREEYDKESSWWLWENMQREKNLEVSEPFLTQVKAILDADAAKPEAPQPVPPTSPDPSVSPVPSPTPTPTPTPVPTAPPGGWRQYGEEEWEFYTKVEEEYLALLEWNLDIEDEDLTDKIVNELKEANKQFKLDIEALCLAYNIKVKSWSVTWRVNYEKEDNEIEIDFR